MAVVRFIYTLSIRVEMLVKQDAGTGIVDVAEVTRQVYPNPVSELLTLDITGARRYTVYDVAGRAVMNGTVDSNDNTVSFATVESGIYFIHLVKEDGTTDFVAKVFKK